MLVRWRGLRWGLLGPVPFDQADEIVAVGSVGAEDLFIKQTLNAAACTHLIRIALGAHWPAHFAVPATTKCDDHGACQPRCHQAEGPLPTRLLSAYLVLPVYLVFVHLGTYFLFELIPITLKWQWPDSATRWL